MKQFILFTAFAILQSCTTFKNIKAPMGIFDVNENTTITANIRDTCYTYYFANNWSAQGLYPKDSITFTVTNNSTFPITICSNNFQFKGVENMDNCAEHWFIDSYRLDAEDHSSVNINAGEVKSITVKNNNFPKSCYPFEANKSYVIIFSYNGHKILSNRFKVCKVVDRNIKSK